MGWKTRALGALDRAGVFDGFRRVFSRGTLILMFHRFCRQGGPGIQITELRLLLEYVRERFRVMTLRELASAFQRDKALPGSLVITVDDGYRDFYEVAFPLLREYGIPATWFITAQFVNRELWLWPDQVEYVLLNTPKSEAVVNTGAEAWRIPLRGRGERLRQTEQCAKRMKRLPHAERRALLERLAMACEVELPKHCPEEYRPASWDELREIAAAGIEIGAHSMTHPILSTMSEREAEWEISASKELIEQKLGARVDSFCFPNGQAGDFNESCVQAIRRAGYLCATTSIQGVNRPGMDLFQLFRYPAPENDFLRFKQTVSGVEELKRVIRQRFARSD